MTLQYTVQKYANGKWLFQWSPDTPPYQIWLKGYLLLSGLEDEEYLFEGSGYETLPPPLEILNDGDSIENELYPPYIILQWQGVSSASAYYIEEYVGTTWIQRALIMEKDKGYYKWATPFLEDAELAQWRIVAVDIQGNRGNPLTFSIEIVRNPSPPLVLITYSGGNIIVNEA